MTHTPGPWTVQKAGRVTAGPVEICQHMPELGIPQEQYEANARVIAAAPELLDVAQAIVTAFGDITLRDHVQQHLYEGARAAIAKATQS